MPCGTLFGAVVSLLFFRRSFAIFSGAAALDEEEWRKMEEKTTFGTFGLVLFATLDLVAVVAGLLRRRRAVWCANGGLFVGVDSILGREAWLGHLLFATLAAFATVAELVLVFAAGAALGRALADAPV